MKIEKATRKKSRLRLALTGPSGSGKTLGALMIAKGLGGRIALIDTEKRSASLYASPIKLPGRRVFEPPEFDVLELSAPYSPERYREAIDLIQAAGYDCLIVDSTTHEWSGVGGCLELVDEVARAKFKGNSWSAWSEVTPRHRAFIDSMLQTTMHVIATGRSKTETAQTEDNGRKRVVRLGMKTEQRDGFEYDFTIVLDIVHDGHFALASKDRTGLFMGDPKPISEETGRILRAWLETGAEKDSFVKDMEAAESESDSYTTMHNELYSAANSGKESLRAAFDKLVGHAGFDALWKAERKTLKMNAERSEIDPDGNIDDSPPETTALVDAAGTYLGELE